MDLIWDDDDADNIIMLIMQDSDTEDISDNSSDDEEDSVDEEADPPPHIWGSGSRIGKAPNVERRRVFYSHLLFNDVWGSLPVYNATYFKQFFKLPIGVFDDIVAKVVSKDR